MERATHSQLKKAAHHWSRG